MINQTVQNAMNEQIKHEFYSAYLYLAMAAYCETIDLSGFARWMQAQAQEELAHGMKFFEHLNEREARVNLQAIGQPPSEFGSPLELFEQVLAHEQKVTGLIHGLYEVSLKENDYASQPLLQWFITEQVEEEATARQIVAELKMVGNHPAGLLMIDRQLGARGG